jgi:hypothetical protein
MEDRAMEDGTMTKMLWIVEEVAGTDDPDVDSGEDMLFNAWSVAYTSIESAKRAVMNHLKNDLVEDFDETPVLVWEPVDYHSSYTERAFIEELTTLFQVRPVMVHEEDRSVDVTPNESITEAALGAALRSRLPIQFMVSDPGDYELRLEDVVNEDEPSANGMHLKIIRIR